MKPGQAITLLLGLVFLLYLAAQLLRRPGETPAESRHLNRLAFLVWIAQGFGAGSVPFAPGTFGSLVGLLWFALLVSAGNLWLFAIATFAGICLSVWVCGAAERILHQTDPGSVVMDEIAAMPLCFWAWIGIRLWHGSTVTDLGAFFSRQHWPLTLGVLVLFRFFDIVKPWPVHQSQRLPGGWGVTADDLLAAIYVNFVVVLVYAIRGQL
jgi:phosphatidylglycerophosphatase A